MTQHPASEQSQGNLVVSYLTLRKAIGILGIALPFVVALGAVMLFSTPLQDSISAYYHTGMGDTFVGMMCAIGVFLLSYKGYERKDDLAGDLACVFAVGVALFPTAPSGPVTPVQDLLSTLHFVSAALLFLTLAYFCLFLFTKSGSGGMTARKRSRNLIYKICGWLILLAIAGIAAVKNLPPGVSQSLHPIKPVFWLEAIAVVSFGFSWLTKGETILPDRPDADGS